MLAFLSLWWAWICVALAFALIELLAPGFIFLGFALGAIAMTLIVSFMTFTNIPMMMALFAALSLLGWIILRALFKRPSSGARIVTEDINDNG